jgi:hypothetical protein
LFVLGFSRWLSFALPDLLPSRHRHGLPRVDALPILRAPIASKARRAARFRSFFRLSPSINSRRAYANSMICDVDAVASAHNALRAAFWTRPLPSAGLFSLRDRFRRQTD